MSDKTEIGRSEIGMPFRERQRRGSNVCVCFVPVDGVCKPTMPAPYADFVANIQFSANETIPPSSSVSPRYKLPQKEQRISPRRCDFACKVEEGVLVTTALRL